MRGRLLLVPALALFASGLFAGTPMTNLTVEVKTLGGRPIDRAAVIVKFIKGRSYVKLGKKVRTTYEMRTNQEGLAKIPPIPQGQIQIQVIAKGYQTFGNFFDVDEPDKTVEVELKPPQSQYSSHQ